MMGLMDGCVPGSRCAAILGADKCQKDRRTVTKSPSNLGLSEVDFYSNTALNYFWSSVVSPPEQPE